MDTAKVDIRKLQLLNDRINQTIDALNQVRFSVHGLASAQGLSHASPNAGFGQQGIGQGQNPYASTGQGFGFAPFSGFGFQNPALGFAHSAIAQGQVPPGVGSYGPGQVPFPISLSASPQPINPVLAQNPALMGFPASAGAVPFGQPGIAGLSHTAGFGAEAGRGLWGDPYLAAQIAQTFPYSQLPVPPVMTVY